MTNGKKFKEVFKDTIADVGYDGLTNITKVSIFHNHYVLYFLKDWWNAEYKESTNKDDLGVDCISRQEVLRLLANSIGKTNTYLQTKVLKMSSVTPQEPRKGHWIETHDDWGNGIITDRRYKCSVCHGKHIDPETGEWHEVFDYKYPFCPNCGAKMIEPQESEE